MIALPAFDLAKVLAAAAIAAGIFAAGMATHKVFADRKFAQLEAKHATQVADWERRVAEAQAAARQQETTWRAIVDEARAEADSARSSAAQLNQEIQNANARIDRLDVANRSLRNAASAYAAGRGSEDTVAACQARSGRLATALADSSDLLSEGIGLLIESTEMVRAAAFDADSRRGKLIACLKAWPKSQD